jgi:hypothetical protein
MLGWSRSHARAYLPKGARPSPSSRRCHCAAPLALRQRRAQSWGGSPGARRAAHSAAAQIKSAIGHACSCTVLPSSSARLSSSAHREGTSAHRAQRRQAMCAAPAHGSSTRALHLAGSGGIMIVRLDHRGWTAAGHTARCVICEQPAILRSPRGKPCHWTCTLAWTQAHHQADEPEHRAA